MLYPIESHSRAIQDLNGIWQLAFDPDRLGVKKKFHEKRPSDLMEIAVPGSINEQVIDRGMNHSMAWFWYYRSFSVSPLWKGKRMILRFGSATFRAEVFLNGKRLGEHIGGYMPFVFDITEVVQDEGLNELVVRVDNDLSGTTIPQGHLPPSPGVTAWRPGIVPNVHYDFFPFSGIHRPVQLLAVPETRLENIRLTTTDLKGDTAQLAVAIQTHGDAKCAVVKIPELDVEKTFELSDGQGGGQVRVAGVTAWAPLAAKLYDVHIHVCQSTGEIADHYIEPFGFRTVEISGSKLKVNGEPVYLRGFGRHEDNNIVGKGQSLPHLVKEYNLMKWVGANSYRTSHYPYSEEDLRMADRRGFLVINEAAANTLSFQAIKGDEAATQALYDAHVDHLNELFTRDYNHPCVIAWSLGNECETWEENSLPYFTDLVAHAKTLDPIRPITAVCNSRPGDDFCFPLFDIICVNRYPAWYGLYGQVEKIQKSLKSEFDNYWKLYKKPILLTEFGADAINGLHNEYNLMWTEEYQVSYLREVLEAAEAHPCVVGAHIWNFADFKVGQHTSRIVHNWKGIFTRERHPKMAAHLVRQWWTGKKPADAHEFGSVEPNPPKESSH
jgi:beta-glucuronidase